MNKTFQRRVSQTVLLCLSITAFAVTTFVLAEPQPEKEDSKVPPIILQATQGLTDNKSLRVASQSADYKGNFVYGDFVPLPSPDGPDWKPFLKFGQTGSVEATNPLSVFRVNGINHKAFDPQFSPNGKTVLFKVGRVGDRYDQYRICFWNLAANQVQEGPDKLSYLLLHWSPDSNHVAYVSGGDVDGNPLPRGSLRLHVYDVNTGKSRFVAQDPKVTMMAWTPQNDLLYNVQSTEKVSESIKSNRIDLYKAPADGSEPILLLKDAFTPRPSPDGKKVAFFAWPEPDAKTKSRVQAQLGLYSYDLEQKKRTLLRPAFSRLKFVAMRWMPDSRRLLTFQSISPSPDAQVQVASVDTANSMVKNLVVIKAKDFQPLGSRIDAQPQFRLREVSIDGKTLLVEISEFVGYDSSLLVEEKSVQTINLETGKADVIVKVKTS